MSKERERLIQMIELEVQAYYNAPTTEQAFKIVQAADKLVMSHDRPESVSQEPERWDGLS